MEAGHTCCGFLTGEQTHRMRARSRGWPPSQGKMQIRPIQCRMCRLSMHQRRGCDASYLRSLILLTITRPRWWGDRSYYSQQSQDHGGAWRGEVVAVMLEWVAESLSSPRSFLRNRQKGTVLKAEALTSVGPKSAPFVSSSGPRHARCTGTLAPSAGSIW